MTNADEIAIDPEVLKLLTKETASALSAIPLRIEDDALVIAVPDDHEASLIQDLAFLIGKKLRPEPASRAQLSSLIGQHYGISLAEKVDPKGSHHDEIVSLGEERPEVAESGFDGSAVHLANKIIAESISMKASDIHVEPYEKVLRIRYRLDGVLREMHKPSPAMTKPLISRLKIMADLDIAEKRRPQDGRIRVKEGGRTIDIRVSSLPTDFGEKLVLRILDKSSLQLDLEKLGFEAEDLKVFRRALHLPYGMILVTGPTGSGKTTTLYAALSEINKPEINITTIEDPIEYNLQGINQTHVRSDIGLDFAAALRSILRQDPNVIMVGEIRDSETAEIAIRAALTGHLVFSTLHTNDSPSAITRLIDMGVEPFLVASSLKLVLAQRLLRKLCPDCKTPYKASQDPLSDLAPEFKDLANTLYRATGCKECNSSGYRGRTAVYERLSVSSQMAEFVTKAPTAGAIKTQARSIGMQTLREVAVAKAVSGGTSIEEVTREISGE